MSYPYCIASIYNWFFASLILPLRINLSTFTNIISWFYEFLYSISDDFYVVTFVGRVGKLSIKIPWKKLGWDPIIIILEDVYICVSQRDDKEVIFFSDYYHEC